MFKRIILAFKFNSTCRSALEKAVQLSVFSDAELLIYHALDYRLKGRDQKDSEIVELNRKMEQKFETEIKPLIQNCPKIRFGSSPSDPALEICKIARESQADLILLGCHDEPERPRLARLDYVGVTILEKAPCPVMLVPP